ncbi:extracellular solute-binding protein [Actinomadura madurae]|uniref:extracellular solute-binding protein n=1 Tax=Actinomadura madurae TaxID=1993 RepID=UPI002025FE18|nr:extracellular solute-binding protein [Actinomadura madurae]MCP9972167.1 extracellular solute-binding protein [Actinomadura madurae]MCP9984672.1 extracellular solute-binding protein [Actinomadura madurae]MCQ0003776.1 extracellular solute-binding protein [Actinomadura madurae]URN00885.1 extracellular solute-binding protein [Actinomadura madurae]URN03033.1 extracellular solute-binding protein [Actinomadura madurae]
MRRNGLWLAAVGGTIATLLTACGTGGASAGKSLTFVSYGKGAYQDGQEKGWLRPFEDSADTKVRIGGPSDNAKLRAMVDAGRVTWDVVDTDAFLPREFCGKLVEPIDVGDLKGAFPPGTLSECGVPAAFFGLLFMYNERTYGDKPPTKLADFFDRKAFPGKRVVFGKDPAIGVLEAALLADGIPKDRLYPMDVDRALGVYDRVRSDLTFAQTYGQQQQLMVDNQADLTLVVSARAYSVLQAGGSQWKPVWDTIPVSWDTLVIPKGSPNKQLGEQLIRFASQPKQAAAFAQVSGAGPANITAEPQLNDLQQQVNAFDKKHAGKLVYNDADWWAKHHSEVVDRWSKWQIG